MSHPISAPPIDGELRITAGRLDITGEIVQDKTLTVQQPLSPDMMALVKRINEPAAPPAEHEVGMATYVIRPKQVGRYKGVRRMKDQPIRVAAPGTAVYAILTLVLLSFGITVQINPILWANPIVAVASIPALIMGGLFLALAIFPSRR